jgi:hypothetical protein
MGRKRRYKKWTSAEFSIYVKQPYYGQYKIMKKIAKIENYEQYERRKKRMETESKLREARLKIMQIRMKKEIDEIIQQKGGSDSLEDSSEET